MYAAILFNQENELPLKLFMYGCVTNAYDWHFMRLENKQLEIDNKRFFINEIDNILGIFSFIVSHYEKA